jgi:hypothetical protein
LSQSDRGAAMRKMATTQTSFPARTPVSAIRHRGSQALFRAKLLGALVALFFALSPLCPAAQSVTLSWDANSEPDIAGYRVHYRTSSGDSNVIDAGNTTRFTVPNLADGITYLFTVTAYNDASLESQPSNEVSHTAGSVGIVTLTVNNGSGDGNYTAGALVVVSANPPPQGSQFSTWTGDTPILANPLAPTTTATIPSLHVTITATYSASD